VRDKPAGVLVGDACLQACEPWAFLAREPWAPTGQARRGPVGFAKDTCPTSPTILARLRPPWLGRLRPSGSSDFAPSRLARLERTVRQLETVTRVQRLPDGLVPSEAKGSIANFHVPHSCCKPRSSRRSNSVSKALQLQVSGTFRS
jgi:hypothetical protein